MKPSLTITPDPTLSAQRQREVLERVRLMFAQDKEVRVEVNDLSDIIDLLEKAEEWTRNMGHLSRHNVHRNICLALDSLRGPAKAGAADTRAILDKMVESEMEAGTYSIVPEDFDAPPNSAPVPEEQAETDEAIKERIREASPAVRAAMWRFNAKLARRMQRERDAARSALREAEQREADLRRECAESR